MLIKSFCLRRWFASFLLAIAGVLAVHPASALTVAFVLNNITYSNTSGPFFNGVSTGNGLISWTYAAGNFQNGTGNYVSVNLPPYTIPPSSAYGPVYTADAVSVTGTITQNVDTYWFDYSISYSPALSGPNSTAAITGGSYDLDGSQPGTGISGNFLGQVIGGTVTPYTPALSFQKSGTNAVVSWPTNYADGFLLESTSSLQPGGLWTTSSVPVNVLGQNYVVTNVVATNTIVFFRLVR